MEGLAPWILQARLLAEQKKFDECAQLLIENLTKNRPAVKPGQGLTYLIGHGCSMDYYDRCLIPRMLAKGMHLEVAHILWGGDQFNAQPFSVQIIWEKVKESATLLIQGAGSLGKSYSLAAWLLLDWVEDPLHTCIKVVSVNAEHAKRNVFAHIKNLHNNSSIPLPGATRGTAVQASDDDKQGIHLTAIPQGEEGSGRLQGFHPVPRKKHHDKYGILSRVRAILDEAEEIPGGVWADIDNMLITVDGTEHVKVCATANPRDIDSKFGKRCEPEDGWASVSIEDSDRWKSKLGWTVVRLDGAKCENVVQQKLVYAGLLTYEGYKRYLLMGDTSPEYYTMARGWFPEKGLQINVIPRDFIDRSFGRLIFTGPVTYCSSVDLAFEGGDKAIQTVGRFGQAVGYAFRDEKVMFKEPKYALQAEAQFELLKNDPEKLLTQTPFLATQIKNNCKNLAITGDWLIVDRTGNGTGCHDLLMMPEYMGPGVSGLQFGSGSTEMKVFADETQKACDIYDGVVTELFFATRKFMEFDYLKISPNLNTGALTEELCTRRFTQKKKTRVESKGEYKARGHASPDYGDSLTMLVHLVRMKQGFEASMLHMYGREEYQEDTGVVDALPFMSWD